jgi:hypothetical protein
MRQAKPDIGGLTLGLAYAFEVRAGLKSGEALENPCVVRLIQEPGRRESVVGETDEDLGSSSPDLFRPPTASGSTSQVGGCPFHAG